MIRLETYPSYPITLVSQASSSSATTGRPSPRRTLRRRVRRVVQAAMLFSLGFAIGAYAKGELKSVNAHAHHAPALWSVDPGTRTSSGSSSLTGIEGKTVTIMVRPGDTVWALASRYGAADAPLGDSVQAILDINHLGGGAALHPGQSVIVPR